VATVKPCELIAGLRICTPKLPEVCLAWRLPYALCAPASVNHEESRARAMNDEKIQVRVTSSRQTIEVVVLDKRLDRIQVVLGEGVHSVRCDLTPSRSGMVYVGNAMGREIVYERSRDDVKADLARAAGFRDPRPDRSRGK
jgi:hypothetical protein